MRRVEGRGRHGWRRERCAYKAVRSSDLLTRERMIEGNQGKQQNGGSRGLPLRKKTKVMDRECSCQLSAVSYELQAKTKTISAKADRIGHAPIVAFKKRLEARSHK